MDKTSLGDRMKAYEAATGTVLIPRMPTIIRVDGKAFHTFTRRINEENDPTSRYGPSEKMHQVMMHTAEALCDEIQNAVLAYTQSDEISILLRDYDDLQTQQWFGGKVQKIVSVSASVAATAFNFFWEGQFGRLRYVNELAQFDARVFQIPKEDVANYFIWRQKDATRNSVQFIARKHFSHKELHGKSNEQIQEMLWKEHDCNWNDYAAWKKRGSCIIKKEERIQVTDQTIYGRMKFVEDDHIPIFTADREYIERFV